MTMNDEWKKRYQELVDFKNRYGHINVVEKLQHLDDCRYEELGKWVSVQRILYSKHKQRFSNGVVEDNGDLLSNDFHNHDADADADADADNKMEHATAIGKQLTTDQIFLLDLLDFATNSNINNKKSLLVDDGLQSNSRQSISSIHYQELLMDIADAYTIRAVLHSHERKRIHNQLMHNSLKALFAERARNHFVEVFTSDLECSSSKNGIHGQNDNNYNNKYQDGRKN